MSDRSDGYVGGYHGSKGKKVLVFGLGISGIGAGQILERHGAEVIMYDGNQKLTEEKIKNNLEKTAVPRS